jgi:hypothetical protein
MNDDQQPQVDLTAAAQHVDRAIRAAVAPGGLVERRLRPESMTTWEEPSPLAGLHAGLAVIAMAERRTYEYAVKLRSEGTSWAEIADLLGVPYSDSYVRREHTYELVRGPIPEYAGPFDEHNVYWECTGPGGCGQYVTDRGPYESHPADNERGHAEDCRRARREAEEHERASEERDRRDGVRNAAFAALISPFERDTVKRCWWSLRRGGEINGKLSTSEQVAVALVLGDDEFLSRTGYKTRAEAIERVYSKTTDKDKVEARLAVMRAAATGEATS